MSRPLQANATRENPDALPMTVGATYPREVAASLERVWENVYDWEHLPWLHSSSFGSIDLQDSGAWGWRARIGTGAGPSVVELVTDRPNSRYVSRTLEGGLPGMEIWTDLEALGPRRTGVKVAFHIPHVVEERARQIGAMLAATYVTLWDEDEAMMAARQAALDSADGRALTADFGGETFRWDARCPHMLGPLDEGVVEDGCVTCPWHGYRFDLRTGRSVDGRKLKLKSPET